MQSKDKFIGMNSEMTIGEVSQRLKELWDALPESQKQVCTPDIPAYSAH
jgi:hypothetical protein